MIAACSHRFPAAVDPLVIRKPNGQVIAFVMDGCGSWGAGDEAAAWFREWIAERECDSDEATPETITASLHSAIKALPTAIRDCDFHWSFSLTVAICRIDSIVIGGAGSVAAVAIRPSGIDRLFVPVRLVDELLARGTISRDEVKNHKYGKVICSPFFGVDDKPELNWSSEVFCAPGDRVILADVAVFSLLEADASFADTTDPVTLRDAIESYGGSSSGTAILQFPINSG